MPRIKIGGKETDLATAQILNSREAIAVFKVGNKIYKILNNTQQNRTLGQNWRAADKNWGLPTPYVDFRDGQYSAQGNGLWIAVIILEMNAVDVARFFQFTHGGEARLKGWVNTESDKERLKRIRRAFVAANSAGLMDPQGVFLPVGYSPILFFDVHTRPMATTDFDNLIALVDNKLS